ncbi:signal transduction histidine kinase [Paenibacillus cellulosilyticus]|uniref:histidine kinase n=1 Tax=Paenibacillus cellulosilyticus TaxID=375489 RepID=A0A2V2YLZ3_9BACL|nr:HAMP domain-containing sensor histidine kinase [Paenibacillus cellulosilyticus]PWV95305.1 signal transduction histidine kinase [Paenibacillus cellulosilyticus]QKS44080.1 HAMP domain-containing histidine kinase [Paenibacillus cellulosilyticus]
MSIRIRLLLSFSAVVAVAIVLFVLTAFLSSVAITGDMRSISSFYNIHYSIHPLTDEEESIFLDLKYLAKQDPAQLNDQQLLASYDLKLKMVQAGLFVRKDDTITYASPSLAESKMSEALPVYDAANNAIRSTLNVGNRFFSYAKFDFPFPDGEHGSLYVMRERSPWTEVVRTLLPILILVLLAVILLTGLLLYRYVTRSVVRPLDVLRRSAEQIKEGDLQFELKPQSRDEIGQLSMTFEEMRRRLNESIQLQLQYEDNRKQLISNISHDLKTPIATIKGYVEGIRDGLANTPEKLDKYVGTIHDKVTDMGRLVDELLLYSKLDLKREPYSFEPIDLVAFAQDAAEEIGFELGEQGIEVVFAFSVGTDVSALSHRKAVIMADRAKLKRVVDNLVQNSAKFMDKEQKRITLRVGIETGTVIGVDRFGGQLENRLGLGKGSDGAVEASGRLDNGPDVVKGSDRAVGAVGRMDSGSRGMKEMSGVGSGARAGAKAASVVVLEVEDNGAGIRSEVLPHVFERFYRGDHARNSQTGGSGLGLAIAKQIVEGHGGTIEAESRVGDGTTIRIRLPLAEGKADTRAGADE